MATITLPDAVVRAPVSAARTFTLGARLDDIVKIFGQRLDLSVLRQGLRSVDGVRDVSVRLTQDGNTPALKIFVVPSAPATGDASTHAASVIARCTQWVSAHTQVAAMISSWHTGEALPTNAMGKRSDW